MKPLALLAIVVGLTLAGCGNNGGSGGDQPSETTTEATTTTSTTTEAASNCEVVSKRTIKWIESELTITGGGSISEAQAVEAEDPAGFYAVAVRLKGPGLDEPALFASETITKRVGSVQALDAIAKEFSNWPSGGALEGIADQDSADQAFDCLG